MRGSPSGLTEMPPAYAGSDYSLVLESRRYICGISQALVHEYFRCVDEDSPHRGKVWVSANCFEGLDEVYPHRRVSTETNDIGTGSLPGTKRSGLPDDSLLRPPKKIREA